VPRHRHRLPGGYGGDYLGVHEGARGAAAQVVVHQHVGGGDVPDVLDRGFDANIIVDAHRAGGIEHNVADPEVGEVEDPLLEGVGVVGLRDLGYRSQPVHDDLQDVVTGHAGGPGDGGLGIVVDIYVAEGGVGQQGPDPSRGIGRVEADPHVLRGDVPVVMHLGLYGGALVPDRRGGGEHHVTRSHVQVGDAVDGHQGVVAVVGVVELRYAVEGVDGHAYVPLP